MCLSVFSFYHAWQTIMNQFSIDVKICNNVTESHNIGPLWTDIGAVANASFQASDSTP